MNWHSLLQRCCLFPRLPSPLNIEVKSGVCLTEMHHRIFELIRVSMTANVYDFQIGMELSIQSEGKWFLLCWYTLLWVYLTIMPQCIWGAVKRKEHILQNWQGVFFWLSELFVLQLFFGDDSFNNNNVHFFFLWKSLPEAYTLHFESWRQPIPK